MNQTVTGKASSVKRPAFIATVPSAQTVAAASITAGPRGRAIRPDRSSDASTATPAVATAKAASARGPSRSPRKSAANSAVSAGMV